MDQIEELEIGLAGTPRPRPQRRLVRGRTDTADRMIEHELVDEFQLDTARYEPDARTTTRYRIDDRGQLLDRDDIPASRSRLPNEPVAIMVTTEGRDLGQLVLIPERERRVTDDQLFLASNLAALLAGLIHEAQD